MTTTFKSRWLCLPVLLCSISFGWATNPSGAVSLHFDDPTTALWDLSGSYNIQHPVDGVGTEAAEIAFFVGITCDARGGLKGEGTTLVTLGNYVFAASYTATGRVSGSGGAPRVTLSIRLKGQDEIAGSLRAFTISVKENLTVNPIDLTLNGTAKGSVSISNFGKGKINTDVSVPVPNGDGSWTADVNVVPLNKLAGDGTVSVGNQDLAVDLTGSYSTSKDLSKITLSGRDSSRGTKVNLQLMTDDQGYSSVLSMKAKVLGQSVRQ